MTPLDDLAAQVRAGFSDDGPVALVAAPGRVNLIGDHTDYNEGFVLPAAIDRECVVGWRATTSGHLTMRSRQFDGLVDISSSGRVNAASVEPSWGRFAAGVVAALADRGGSIPGADLVISSTVPAGSGLSSSSALAVALTLALGDAAGFVLDRRELARIALDAEVRATGVPGGLMDQLASLFGERGHALLIDCRSLAIEPIPMPSAYAILVVHSGLPRVLAHSEYASRRAECEAAATRLGLTTLRDATLAQVADDPRARHVVTENARVLEFAGALRAGEAGRLGPLLLASHASLRDDFGVSTPELDFLVEALVENGAIGARLTGAGFGGCVVALVQRNHADDVAAKTVAGYRAETGIDAEAFVVWAVGRAGPLGARTET
jgi:galactokinase